MTLAGAKPDPFAAAPAHRKYPLPPLGALALIWAIWATANMAIVGPVVAAGDLGDTDNYMRLVQWRDFLSGQDWFDVHQYRFVGPESGDMHFSRLPDLLLSIPFWPLSAIFGGPTAERIVLIAYPPLLMLVFLRALSGAAREVGGKAAAIAAIPLALLASPVAQQFAPGRIDHHGLGLCLSMAALWLCLIGLRSPSYAIAAAISAALAAAVSLETAPIAAAGFAVYGLNWIVKGDNRGLRNFGGAAAASSVVLFVATLGAAGFANMRCDAFASPAMSALAGAGALALLLSCMRTDRAAFRLWAAFAAASVGAAALFAAYPHCKGGPFAAMDPLVRDAWLNSVGEIRSPVALMQTAPGTLLAYYGFPMAALAVAFRQRLYRTAHDRFDAHAAMLVFLAASSLLLLAAVRGSILATAFSVVPFAVFLANAAHGVRFFPPQNAARFLALFLVASPASYAALGSFIGPDAKEGAAAGGEQTASCADPRTIGALNALPASLIFTPIDLGPLVLAMTDHSVTAAPYHRNDLSMRRTIVFFTQSDSEALKALTQSGADYLIFCPNSSEARAYAAMAPHGLARRMLAGDAPGWLQRVDVDGAGGLEIYRTAPAIGLFQRAR